LYNNICNVVFCALHEQLASLERHTQLTRCFSAVAELLVNVLFVVEICKGSENY